MEETVLNAFTDNDERSINIDRMKTNIKDIAAHHAKVICDQPKGVISETKKLDVGKLIRELKSLKFYNELDELITEEGVETLETSVSNIMESSVLVQDPERTKLVPLPYEVLRIIFSSTNEKFRQFFFTELMEHYYRQLCEYIKSSSSTSDFSREDFDQQVKAFLPIVKIQAALDLAKNKNSESRRLLEEVVSNISSYFKYPRLNQEDIYAIVNNKVGSTKYKLISYDMLPLDERNGHLGDYFKLKICVEVENDKKIFDLFAKFLTPKLESMKAIVRSGPSKKEEFFYMTYLPLLEKHGLQSLLEFSPRCYLSRLHDVLILDDMGSLGYSSVTPNVKLEFDGLMFVVKQIAKFHSCSIILDELLSENEGKRTTLDEIYGEYFIETFYNFNDKFMKGSLDATLDLIHYLITKFPEVNRKLTQAELIRKIDAGWTLLLEQVSKSRKFKNTMNHGDMYVANMLFKFDPSGKCHGATLVDFQLLRYCSPAHDLLFFIYQNSFKETRDKHLRQLIDEYYLDLSKHLGTFNLDIAKIYPKEEFEESLNYMKSQAIFQCLFYSPACSLEPNLREEIFQDEELSEKFFTSDRRSVADLGLVNDAYRDTLRGLIADLVGLCETGLL